MHLCVKKPEMGDTVLISMFYRELLPSTTLEYLKICILYNMASKLKPDAFILLDGFCCCCCFVFVVLGFELRTSCLLGRCSPLELLHQPFSVLCIFFFFFSMSVMYVPIFYLAKKEAFNCVKIFVIV
jgi:hypothetical protein